MPLESSDLEARDADKVNDAVSAFLDGKIGPAITLLKEVIANAPEPYVYQYEQAGALCIKFWDEHEFLHYATWQRGRPEERRVCWILSAYPRAFFYLGYLAVKAGEYRVALRILERGQRLEPTNSKFFCEKAQAHIALGQFDRALELYDKLHTIGPFVSGLDKARALRGRGFVLIEQGELDAAERAFRDSLTLEPDSELAHNELAYLQDLRAGGAPVPQQLIPTWSRNVRECASCGDEFEEGLISSRNGVLVAICRACDNKQKK